MQKFFTQAEFTNKCSSGDFHGAIKIAENTTHVFYTVSYRQPSLFIETLIVAVTIEPKPIDTELSLLGTLNETRDVLHRLSVEGEKIKRYIIKIVEIAEEDDLIQQIEFHPSSVVSKFTQALEDAKGVLSNG